MAKNRILMFSGGLDSYIMKRIFKFADDECLFVYMGTQENKIEQNHIHSKFPGVLETSLEISEFELSNKIIPFRNHYLCLTGAQFSNNIYFAFTAGDTTKDKDYVYKSQMEGILNYFSLDEDKVKTLGPYEIHLPLKVQSKSQIVSLFLNSYPKEGEDLIFNTISCYSGIENGCGECRSCLRKFTAISAANQSLGNRCREVFNTDPAKGLAHFLDESIAKERSQREIQEIKQCIRQVKQ